MRSLLVVLLVVFGYFISFSQVHKRFFFDKICLYVATQGFENCIDDANVFVVSASNVKWTDIKGETVLYRIESVNVGEVFSIYNWSNEGTLGLFLVYNDKLIMSYTQPDGFTSTLLFTNTGY